LKKQVLQLLPKIRSVKYGDLEIDLEEKLKAVEEDLSSSVVQTGAPVAPVLQAETAQLASISPRAAIMHSWFEVESALNNLIVTLGWEFAPRYSSYKYKLKTLKNSGHINDLTESTFLRLAAVRNDAAHLTDRQVAFDDAVSMSASCAWLIEVLEDATQLVLDERSQKQEPAGAGDESQRPSDAGE
jgi:hypothetical protein